MLFLYLVVGVFVAFLFAICNAKGWVKGDEDYVLVVMCFVTLFWPICVPVVILFALEKLARRIVCKKEK